MENKTARKVFLLMWF